MNNVQQAIRDAAEKGRYRYRWWKVNDLEHSEGYNGLQLRALTTVAWAVDHSAAPRRLSDVCPRWLVETGLLGWACEIRTQKRRRKLSL